jgi:tetratricopeptide (TPR) repeat protein
MLVQDNTLLNSIEALTQAAEEYNIAPQYILHLLRHRLIHALFIRDDANLMRLQERFSEVKTKRNFNSFYIDKLSKISYSECLFVSGLYEMSVRLNLDKGIELIEEAERMVYNIPSEPELKVSIYGQLAQYNIDHLNSKLAEENLTNLLLIKKQHPNVDLSLRLYYMVKFKELSLQGHYLEALVALERCIQESGPDVSIKDPFNANILLYKAKFLNRLNKFEEALSIVNPIYYQESARNYKNDNYSFALIELSAAYEGLGNTQLALKYANEAVTLILNNKSMKEKDEFLSYNHKLADAYIVKGNAHSALKETSLAIEAYLKAEAIYYNRYKYKMKYSDNVSYLYYRASLATANMENKDWFNKFSRKHFKYFR